MYTVDRRTVGTGFVVAASISALGLVLFTEAFAARRPAPTPTTPPPQPSFVDQLDGFDTRRWSKADGWANGSPFDNGWRAGNVAHSGGLMTLTLDDVDSFGQPYTSGELRTNGYYGYGCYEARFKPIKRPGVVTSFFTFAGPYDNGGNGRHNEIDVEFVGSDTRRVQFNFWTNDDRYVSNNAYSVQLGFDASTSAANYGFKWTAQGIAWHVNGNLVYTATSTGRVPTPRATDSLHKIMMNAWPVDETAALWAGTFVYPGTPMIATYEWVRYDSSPDCNFQILPLPVN